MRRIMMVIQLLTVLCSLGTTAFAADCRIVPNPPTQILQATLFTISTTCDVPCPTCVISIHDSTYPGSPLYNQVYSLKSSVPFVFPEERPGAAGLVIKISNGSTFSSYPFNIVKGPYGVYWNPNYSAIQQGKPATVDWWAPGTTHPGDLITVAATDAAGQVYQSAVPVPDGAYGKVAITATTPNTLVEIRYVSATLIRARTQPLSVLSNGTAPPPPTIRCTITLVSGTPTVGSLVTGTVVSCP